VVELKPLKLDNNSDLIWVYDFTEETATDFHERVTQKFEENPHKPITIHINSFGGEVTSLMAMLDTMDSIRAIAPEGFSFITVAKGKAISAGAVLLSYGDFRFAEPKAQIMIHQVVGGTFGSHPENESEFQEIDRMNLSLLSLLKKKCKLALSMKELKDLLAHNLYLTPQEAKVFGLIDVVGYPKLMEFKSYELRVVSEEVPPKEHKRANRRTNKKSTSRKS
jgi:ATP-dependent Clp protease, protease subunit